MGSYLAFLVLVAITGSFSFWGGEISEAHETFALHGSFVEYREWYRLLASGFLHYGILHLALNLVLLVKVGRQHERLIGGWRLLLICCVAIMGAILGELIVNPRSLTAVGSGAALGLAGYSIVIDYAAGIPLHRSGTLALAAINTLVCFFMPNVSVIGHIAGFITGGIMALILLAFFTFTGSDVTTPRSTLYRSVPVLLVLGVGVVCFTLAVFWAAPNWRTPLF